jgi:hypothetical protein
VLLALDDNLLQSVDELLPSLLGEDIVNKLLGLLDSIVELLSVLLGDSLLELLGLVSGLLLSIFGIVGHVGSVGLPVGLGLGLGSLVVSSAEDLVLLLREGCVGVSVVVEVLGVRLDLLLGGTLGLFLLLLGFLLLLLSLIVCVTGRSSVALVVGDPVD